VVIGDVMKFEGIGMCIFHKVKDRP